MTRRGLPKDQERSRGHKKWRCLQKLKVIASFDKATNVKEAKVVFESLNNALQTPAKKAIKESFGFASKATGVAQNRTIVESNDVITRMQKLANIIK